MKANKISNTNNLREYVRTVISDVMGEEDEEESLSEEDPCQDGYTMVGTKMKNGEKVPNCVPENDVENYEEATTTANVPGYNTPFAFSSKKDDDEDENDIMSRKRSYLNKLNKQYGYTLVDDVLSEHALQDFKEWIFPIANKNKKIRENLIRFLNAGSNNTSHQINEASQNLQSRAFDMYDVLGADRFILELEKSVGTNALESALQYISRQYQLDVDVGVGRRVYDTADNVRWRLGDKEYVTNLIKTLSDDELKPSLDNISRNYDI